MNRIAVLLMLVLATACGSDHVASSNSAATAVSTSGPHLPRTVSDWLRQRVASLGLGTATSADWVFTTLGKASEIISEAAPDDPYPVYLFDVRGHFEWDHSCPRGAPLSSCRSIGSHEVFTLDPQRMRILDFTVRDEAPNLEPMGPVGHLDL